MTHFDPPIRILDQETDAIEPLLFAIYKKACNSFLDNLAIRPYASGDNRQADRHVLNRF